MNFGNTFAVAFGSALLLAGWAHAADEPKSDWLRERLTSRNWTCRQVTAHRVTADAEGKEDTVKPACLLTVVCTKNADPEPRKEWPALLTIAAGKKDCPSVDDWIQSKVTKEDVLNGAPMMTSHEFAEGVKNDEVAKLPGYGAKCRYEFVPPFVVWRKFTDPDKKFDRLCVNLSRCAEPVKDERELETLACSVADDGGCSSLTKCVEKPVPMTVVPIAVSAKR